MTAHPGGRDAVSQELGNTLRRIAMKTEVEVSKGAVETKDAVRVILVTPKNVADQKRVTMGGGMVTFRKKD